MARRLNYTGRKRVNREDCSIQLTQSDGQLAFDASVALTGYGLDTIEPPPRVFIEAYRGASTLWRRFDFGVVGSVAPPADRSLRDFGTLDDVLFRLKVTAQGEREGRLLASADRISPALPDGRRPSLPLIAHIAADDIGHELWRVQFDDDSDLPVLKVNSSVSMGVDQFVVTPEYRAIFAPAVMRQVLSRILVVDADTGDDEDDLDWRCRWLRFAGGLPGVGECPGPLDRDGANADAIDAWINDAVEAFAKGARLLDRFAEMQAMGGLN